MARRAERWSSDDRRPPNATLGSRGDVYGAKRYEPYMSALPEVTTTSFSDEVLESDKPVLVDFWAPWCGPCRMLAPVVEKLAASVGDQAKFVKLNTDQHPEIAGQYQVSGIPCLILFKGGQAVDRIVGFVPEQQIAGMLARHIAA